MSRTKMIREILTDCAEGQGHSLIGLVDWLVVDKGIPMRRLLVIAERRFGIPQKVLLTTLSSLS